MLPYKIIIILTPMVNPVRGGSSGAGTVSGRSRRTAKCDPMQMT